KPVGVRIRSLAEIEEEGVAALPGLQSLPMDDPCQVSNYTQRYSYDA
ncbi:YD repeat-containing protein, partial [Pseudomonas syringae pv. pisi str. 1704B]